jgi:hypothetical protein
MQFIVVGILKKYGPAQDAVQELEQVGIVGGQVELITDIDEDVRTADTPHERSTNSPQSHDGPLARLFAAIHKPDPDVRDESGKMPNYIGEQEFYANHVKAGGVVMVVRTSTEQAANQAAAILKKNGARTPGQDSGPVVRAIG